MASKAKGRRQDGTVLATERRATSIAEEVIHSYDLDQGSQLRSKIGRNERRIGSAHISLEQLEGELEEERLRRKELRERITALEETPLRRLGRWLRTLTRRAD